MPESRRKFLKQLGLIAGGALVYGTGMRALGNAFSSAYSPINQASANSSSTPIKHVILACQENRSFDSYYGYYPGIGKYGVPTGYYQPNGSGGKVFPYMFSEPFSQDPNEGWETYHEEYDGGKMDGFYIYGGGEIAMGYYTADYLSYYYSLARSFTLCGNYFCYTLSETLPNRLGLWTGTCGGNTTNNVNAGTLDYPTIVDLLDAYGITWKCYNMGSGTGWEEGYNPLYYFQKWENDERLYYPEADYYLDLQQGTLPQVSFMITEDVVSEHPPADIVMGENAMKNVIDALMSSSFWNNSALFLTYDEHGGYFEHVPPKQFDAYGEGIRIPMLVVSPYAKQNHVSGQLNEHSSVLKFIEKTFGLPTLASVNHQFDSSTPGTNNDAADGNEYGPPAPPRDKYREIGDLSDAFDFAQEPLSPLVVRNS